MNSKFKWMIKDSIIIDATFARVWEVISQPGSLNLCHPFCKENIVKNWSGKDSADRIIYYNGMELERNFIEWEIEKGYKFLIGKKEEKKKTEVHYEIKKLKDVGEGEKTLVLVSLKMPDLERIPVILRWIPHFLYLKPKMKKYQDSVLKGFEYYIKTGKPVERNQFGSHSLFSPEVI